MPALLEYTLVQLGILNRLVVRGLVTRTRSRVDRRIVEIELTAQGNELATGSPEVVQGLLVKWLETLPEEKLVRN